MPYGGYLSIFLETLTSSKRAGLPRVWILGGNGICLCSGGCFGAPLIWPCWCEVSTRPPSWQRLSQCRQMQAWVFQPWGSGVLLSPGDWAYPWLSTQRRRSAFCLKNVDPAPWKALSCLLLHQPLAHRKQEYGRRGTWSFRLLQLEESPWGPLAGMCLVLQIRPRKTPAGWLQSRVLFKGRSPVVGITPPRKEMDFWSPPAQADDCAGGRWRSGSSCRALELQRPGVGWLMSPHQVRFCPPPWKPNTETTRLQQRERGFTHKAAMWGGESMSLKPASLKVGTEGYLWGRGQGGLKCGDRWLEVRRGEVIDDVLKRSRTSCLFTGPMLTKRQHELDLRLEFLVSWHQHVAYGTSAQAQLMSWWSQLAWSGPRRANSWRTAHTPITVVTQAPGRRCL